MPGRGASRLSVRPTARGWQALFAGVVTLVVARLIGTTQFHQLAYALLALALASLVIGVVGSRGLRYSRALPPGVRIIAGSPAKLRLLLERSRFGAPKASVVDHLPGSRSFDFSATRERSRIEVPLTFARRGVYTLGPAEIRVADPFGLLRFARKDWETTEVVVYPQVYELRGLPLRGGNVEAGTTGSRGRRGEEFEPEGVPQRRRQASHPLEESGAHGGAIRQGVFPAGPEASHRGPGSSQGGPEDAGERGRGCRICSGLGAHASCLGGSAFQAARYGQ